MSASDSKGLTKRRGGGDPVGESGDRSKRVDCCLELCRIPFEDYALPDAEFARRVEEKYIIRSKPGGFKEGEFAGKVDIAWYEEATVVVMFAIMMGGPFAVFFSGIGLLLFGSWKAVAIHALVTAVLAFHPLPKGRHFYKSRLSHWAYKYFSYRFMWTEGDWEKIRDSDPWVGAGPPHGALPIANLLSIPALNLVMGRPFVGGPASVVYRTPFLRYMWTLGCVDVGSASMARAVSKGLCVGICPDGIRGIFTETREKEVVVLKTRKGLAKFSLRNNIPLVPAYSMGNTAAFRVFFDPWGFMRRASSFLRVSLFLVYGRFGLPIPFRTNICMFVSAPIVPPKVDGKPAQEDIDVLHERLLNDMEANFERHKAAGGWNYRKLVYV